MLNWCNEQFLSENDFVRMMKRTFFLSQSGVIGCADLKICRTSQLPVNLIQFRDTAPRVRIYSIVHSPYLFNCTTTDGNFAKSSKNFLSAASLQRKRPNMNPPTAFHVKTAGNDPDVIAAPASLGGPRIDLLRQPVLPASVFTLRYQVVKDSLANRQVSVG